MSGAFMNLDVPGHGMIARFGNDGSFSEAVTLMQTHLISFGSCRRETVR